MPVSYGVVCILTSTSISVQVRMYEPVSQPRNRDPCTRAAAEDSIPPDLVGDDTTIHHNPHHAYESERSTPQQLERSLRTVIKHWTRLVGNNCASGLSAGQSCHRLTAAASGLEGCKGWRTCTVDSAGKYCACPFFFFFCGEVRLGVRYRVLRAAS